MFEVNRMPNKPIVAIMYDFDKTLCSEDMQNYSFIPALGMKPAEFWDLTTQFVEKENVEKILAYMYMMVLQAREKGIKLTKEYLNSLGKAIKYYEGVTTWFSRMNAYGESLGLTVEHYLVSSGTKEIIDGCSIAKEFKAIYGCEFLFDEVTGEAIWPKYAINYTMKTQYFFRVSKGVIDSSDDVTLNQRTRNRRIPYRNIVYIGDGMTDIPCMILVKENGGKSIAVYQKDKKDRVMGLLEDGRVNYICRADYKSGSELETILKLVMEGVSVTEQLIAKENALINK